MDKILYDRYDKSSIRDLPTVSFGGRIFVITTERGADKAVNYLLGHEILGVDTETRPSFKKGHIYKVSLLQVSTMDECFLFRLNIIGMPQPIIRFLEDDTVLKVGLSWHDDILSLQKRAKFKPGRFFDIQKHVGEIGVEDLSLQKLYANFFHQRISKTQRLSNWEADILTDKQKIYAATDAWACIRLYNELMRLERTNNYKLEHAVPQAEPTIITDSDISRRGEQASHLSTEEPTCPTAGANSEIDTGEHPTDNKNIKTDET